MSICRLCLSNGRKFIHILDQNDLLTKIKCYVFLEISSTDNLPKTICSLCVEKINEWCQFKEMCIDSDKKLKRLEKQEMLHRKGETDNISKVTVNCKFSESEDDEVLDGSDKEVSNEEFYNVQIKTECLQSTYFCEICYRNFDTFVEYLDHQDEHNGQPVFNCDKCKEVFTTRSELVEHENNHKEPCPKCSKMVLKASMRLHLVQHTDRYMCTVCSHRFCSKTTLSQHVITVHTNIKDHICETCGKSFSSKTAINVHLKTHKEEREYTCKLCNYAGRTSSAIYIHMATHANEVHCCEMCAKTFKSVRNLRDHLRRSHSKLKKHQCSYCDKKFVDKYMMMVHVRTHTGVRPYKCNLCDKAFIRSDSLKEHVGTHGSKKFYNCDQCMKKFTSKRGFARHSCITSSIA